MLLGDLLVRFSDEAVVEETILYLDDLALLADLRAQSQAAGMPLGAYAAAVAARYAAEAPEDEWLTLIGSINRAADPGNAYLRRAFVYVTRTQSGAL